MVSTEFLDKFKKLYKDKYNITLSDEEATRLGTHFLNLMKILIKPKASAHKEGRQNYPESEAKI